MTLGVGALIAPLVAAWALIRLMDLISLDQLVFPRWSDWMVGLPILGLVAAVFGWTRVRERRQKALLLVLFGLLAVTPIAMPLPVLRVHEGVSLWFTSGTTPVGRGAFVLVTQLGCSGTCTHVLEGEVIGIAGDPVPPGTGRPGQVPVGSLLVNQEIPLAVVGSPGRMPRALVLVSRADPIAWRPW